MEKYVIKRNGDYKPFENYKIQDAIEKAFESVNQEIDNRIFKIVLTALEVKFSWPVEEIQDIIERVLFEKGYFQVMRSFIIYRHTRKLQREHINGLNDDTTYIDSTQTVEEYINESDWRINANANISYSNAGLVCNTAGKIIANYWLDKIYSKEEGSAHRNGDIHIHDLDCLTGYCAGWSLRVLLNEGFNGVRGRVESRPPSHFREALGQMANFLGILQSEWAGAQAFSSFDTYLAPYVFKDQLSYDDIVKTIRSFVYNLNVPARWGQSPFTNITLDWNVPEDLKDQIPTRNNSHLFFGIEDQNLIQEAQNRGVEKLVDLKYVHFQKEMNMINKAYYTIMTEGDANGQPFTFPIPTVNITEDFDWEGENVDLLFENTAKIGSSYFQNFIGSQYVLNEKGNRVENPNAYKPNAVRSMCCRLQLDLRELLKRGNGLFGSAEMTGSIGVVTINMARLGYLHKGNIINFYAHLDELLQIAKSTLEKKRAFIQQLYDRGLYPYTKRYLSHFRNHFSTIGVNGMNEMVLNFSDDHQNITSKSGIHFATEILDHIRLRMQEFQEETGNLYNLEATPAEGTTYRFAKEDKKRFPNIIQAGLDDNIYYTNSSQIPVDYTEDPFEALLVQDELQCKYTGGTVLHLYMREKISSPEACKNFVKTVLTNFKLPYITVTPIFSICPIHGYLNGEHEYCPKCDEIILKENNPKSLVYENRNA
ncbi:ribonucleoside triphosphate reductase [Flavobacterium hungaricum]|uniref:Ribonucleoside triphosphate reductase n=1 Tax=Flavobacterium hungaricum TaxID=2082725 RepID=A0ABR9TG61_9FLAO|nr:ribonucleoside triphosphate reductase [Flavobacterium hungaricum]MBE8724352.1 ribonucleoside triphosphate reductase [Flavobacterium hungaricum]